MKEGAAAGWDGAGQQEPGPPPSYEEAVGPSGLPPPPMVQPGPPPQAGPSSAGQKAVVNRQFPPAFSLYREGGFSRTYTLGEHQAQPLYAVSTHSGWSGQPDLVLHSGPSDDYPPLATADHHQYSRRLTVTLPPLPGDRLARDEDAKFHGLTASTFAFAVEVAAGPDGGGPLHRERFEWRRSQGGEVSRLGGAMFGWKLVRLDGAGGGGGSTTSDGLEVVAVWSRASMSMTKMLRFEFTGAGATGALGERWAVMAVTTALGIWDRERRRSNSAATASA